MKMLYRDENKLTFSLKILLSKNLLGNLKNFMVAATFKLRCYTQAKACDYQLKEKYFLTVPSAKGEG